MLLVAGLALTLWPPAEPRARAIATGVACLLALWLALGFPT